MSETFTISATRQQLGIQVTYELEPALSLLVRLANEEGTGGEQLDCELVRGMAIRARQLVGVLMAVLSNDLDEESAQRIVLGAPAPSAEL
jgi:hypothetical protein